jgi:hypothetical protein
LFCFFIFSSFFCCILMLYICLSNDVSIYLRLDSFSFYVFIGLDFSARGINRNHLKFSSTNQLPQVWLPTFTHTPQLLSLYPHFVSFIFLFQHFYIRRIYTVVPIHRQKIKKWVNRNLNADCVYPLWQQLISQCLR